MPNDPQADSDFLFKGAREDLKKLAADSRKLLREVKRAEWWEKNGVNRPKPNSTPNPPTK